MVLSLQLGNGANAASLANDEAATARYIESIARVLDPEFECSMRFPGMGPVVYRGGVQALEAAWRDRLKHWAEYRVEIEGVIDADTQIVIFHRAHVRYPRETSENVIEDASVWTVRDHLLVRADFNVPQVEARAGVAQQASIRGA